MYKYIVTIVIITLALIFTIINLNETSQVTINLLFTTTKPVPGIILLYLGMLIGAVVSIPIMIYQTKKANKKVFDSYVKKESKWMKKAKKKTTPDTPPNTKTNINQ